MLLESCDLGIKLFPATKQDGVGPSLLGDSCRNGNTRDAGTLKNYNRNGHHFGDIRKEIL